MMDEIALDEIKNRGRALIKCDTDQIYMVRKAPVNCAKKKLHRRVETQKCTIDESTVFERDFIFASEPQKHQADLEKVKRG